MKTITAKQLGALEACTADLELFKQLFGSRASITTANYRKALEYRLSTCFLIEHVLTESQQADFKRLINNFVLGCACADCQAENWKIAPKVVRALRAGKIRRQNED